ncbi:MAG: hypothetical protein LH468_05790 [Nocardioides sp.]|nr:hypothetical protein [Nocardioides sp.]
MTPPTRVVLVPGVLALLPSYAGLTDPVADLRAACASAVAWLTRDGSPVTVLGDEQGTRVGHHLLGDSPTGAGSSYLVVGNGSACRTEKAPGHLDARAAGFDAALGAALTGPDPEALRAVDPGLARELWASVDAWGQLGDLLTGDHVAHVHHDDDPFGVQYWVIRWEPA